MRLDQPDHKEKEWQHRSIFDAANDGMIVTDLETGLVVDANPAACKMHGYASEEFIGLPLIAFIHQDSQRAFSEFVQAVQSGGTFDTRALHMQQNDSTFYAEWCGSVLTFQGRPCLLGIIRDVSKRIEAEQTLHRSVETRTHEQATLLEISHTLASTLELQPGLILDQLRKIVEYAHGGLLALEDSTLVTLAMRGKQQLEQSAPIRIDLETPETLTVLFNEHQPIRISDLWSEDPQAKFLRLLLHGGAAVLLEGMRSWMWVPLAVRGRIIGGVGMAHAKLNYFTAHHAGLALSVANQAAITMINAELYKHAQEFAVLEERQRLAHNLHDAVNQSLFSAGLIAEVLPRLWEQNQEDGRRSLDDLRSLTRGAMAEMRALLAELRPTTLTDADLGDLLRLLASAFTGRINIPAQVTVIGESVLPAEVQVTFYRVCQEALNNVAKHSEASNVEISLKYKDTAVELIVRDNGQGFDPGQIASGHYGLSMMQERAEVVGALLLVTSQAGNGTELKLHWTRTPIKETL
jgi:PAS domain S-box-containing protein